ncbi:hypothetical protein [Natranaerovirga pectinivora]|uniref:hypothetical protein n=1 Tax=Natranaerovirga pectinivora TaxID=682400 RepID=UPI001051898A|nr:hypothetical protein [Natranaerovirga pectinivora]
MTVYKFIEKKGYTGKYASVVAFVDWKENITMVSKYGELFNINIFLMDLGFFRRKYICLPQIEVNIWRNSIGNIIR